MRSSFEKDLDSNLDITFIIMANINADIRNLFEQQTTGLIKCYHGY